VPISAKSSLLFSLFKNSGVFGKKRTASVGCDSTPLLLSITQLVVLTSFLSFRILITGGASGLVETITDAVSIHSIKKAEYARRSADERLGHVTLMDHFKNVCSSPIFGLSTYILLGLWGSILRKICPCPAKLCEIASRLLRNHLPPPDQRPP
jgi:hypothetical protein